MVFTKKYLLVVVYFVLFLFLFIFLIYIYLNKKYADQNLNYFQYMKHVTWMPFRLGISMELFKLVQIRIDADLTRPSPSGLSLPIGLDSESSSTCLPFCNTCMQKPFWYYYSIRVEMKTWSFSLNSPSWPMVMRFLMLSLYVKERFSITNIHHKWKNGQLNQLRVVF